jgi:hypothetical protein
MRVLRKVRTAATMEVSLSMYNNPRMRMLLGRLN